MRAGNLAVLQPEERGEADAGEARSATTRPSASARAPACSLGLALLRPARSPRSPCPASAPVVTGCAAVGGLERRLEPRAERVVAAERVRHADVAGEHRADRQHDQRDRHRPGGASCRCDRAHACAACAGVVHGCSVRTCAPCARWCTVRRDAACTVNRSFAVERQVHEAEHVGRRQQRRQHADRPTASGGRARRSRTGSRPSRRSPTSSGTPAIASEPIRNVQ